MLWDRERYLDHMTFHDTGRELFVELFGPLIGLGAEWEKQKATEEERNLSVFGFDWVDYQWCPCNTGALTGLSPKILEETNTYLISVDNMGRKQKLCKGSATIPLPLEYPVKGPEDWERIRHWYQFEESRIDLSALKRLKKKQQNGCLVLASIPGGFDELRQLMGEEALCLACYEEPEMIEDMLHTISRMVCSVMERVSEWVTIDNLHVHEDMAGKSGPLWGPRQVEDFILPYYQKIWEPLKAAGSTLFSQDSDGFMEPVIRSFLKAGVNVMYPCEPAAGMDILRLRKQYGTQLALKGGIDKFSLRGTKEDIRCELEKKLISPMLGGGTVFAIDHRIPNGVPIQNYRYYIRTAREMLGLEPSSPAPFIRMAF